MEIIRKDLSKIQARLKSFSPKDIWNCDETGLFWKMAPDKTIRLSALPGRKKQKDRITIMPCCNADGSEKMELMVIEKSKRPRVFKGKTGAELSFDYHNNKKAWMTNVLS